MIEEVIRTKKVLTQQHTVRGEVCLRASLRPETIMLRGICQLHSVIGMRVLHLRQAYLLLWLERIGLA